MKGGKRLEQKLKNGERTGWRDEEISKRHRMWGKDLTMTDIDFIVSETKGNMPIAIIEYKNEQAAPQSINNWQYQVLKNLSDKAGLPLFNVRYATDFLTYKVTPLNEIAIKIKSRQTMKEYEYVSFLYKLRGTNPPEINTICAEIGWNE